MIFSTNDSIGFALHSKIYMLCNWLLMLYRAIERTQFCANELAFDSYNVEYIIYVKSLLNAYFVANIWLFTQFCISCVPMSWHLIYNIAIECLF